MTSGSAAIPRTNDGPFVAICRTRREAGDTAAALRRAGVETRQIAIVAHDYPSAEAAAGIKRWEEIASAWVTTGCLYAIGSGLEGLGIPPAELGRCRAALDERRILILVRGTEEDLARARRACRGSDGAPPRESGTEAATRPAFRTKRRGADAGWAFDVLGPSVRGPLAE